MKCLRSGTRVTVFSKILLRSITEQHSIFYFTFTIPLCTSTAFFYLFIADGQFIHPLIDILVKFHLLAVMNKATKNIEVSVSKQWVIKSCGVCPGVV